MIKLRRISSALVSLSIAAAILLFLAFPARYAAEVREGISLWAVSILPATLPFLFLTTLFTRRKLFARIARYCSPASQRLFGVSGAGACCMLLSAVSGYPVGARTVLDLSNSGYIGRSELFRTAALSTTTGPAFLVGAVGCGMFRSAAVGWLLFLAHLIGIYTVGILLRLRIKPAVRAVSMPDTPPVSLSEALSGSVLSVLCVGGAIAIFYAFGAMIADISALLALPREVTAVLRGLMEMTTGCALLSGQPTAFSLALCCFFVTFGGLCVLIQQLAFLIPAGVSPLRFISIKLAQGLAAAAAVFLLAIAFGI